MSFLSIQTWPMFQVNNVRRLQLIELIEQVVTDEPGLISRAADTWLGEDWQANEFNPDDFAMGLLRVADADAIKSRTDCATMCVADDQGVKFRVWVAADFTDDHNNTIQSDLYLSMGVLNCFNAIWSQCVEYSQYDFLMKRI